MKDLFIDSAGVLKLYFTHDRAEEMDHSVLCSALAWGSRRSFLRAWRESTSERSLRGTGKGMEGKEEYTCMLNRCMIKGDILA